MTDGPEPPDIGAALAPYIAELPSGAFPVFLAGLERAAANRYRTWASAMEHRSAVLLRCAKREDQIADLVEQHHPVDPETRAAIDTSLVGAVETYGAMFDPLAVDEQLALQAAAERQGGAAWSALASVADNPSVAKALDAAAALEHENAEAIDRLLDRE